MIPKEVCHFTKAEIAIENILSEEKLRIGKLKCTNDPRESRPKGPLFFHRSEISLNSDSKGLELQSKLSSEYKRIQLNEWKVLCVTLHNPQRKSANRDNDIYNSHVRFGYSNPALWAHYAKNHTGVCLIFSGKLLDQNIKNELGSKCKIYNGKVNYTVSSNLTGTPMLAIRSLDSSIENAIRLHLHTYCQELFFHKHPNWGYENEYRWVLHSAEEDHQFVTIQNAIKAVIVGIDFPKELESELIALCKTLNISAGKMDWINGIAYPKLYSLYNPCP